MPWKNQLVENTLKSFKPKYVPYSEWKGAKIDKEGGAKRGITSGNELVRRVPANANPYIELNNGERVFKSDTETKKYPKTFDQYVEESKNEIEPDRMSDQDFVDALIIKGNNKSYLRH
jgi:hypothetical protein